MGVSSDGGNKWRWQRKNNDAQQRCLIPTAQNGVDVSLSEGATAATVVPVRPKDVVDASGGTVSTGDIRILDVFSVVAVADFVPVGAGRSRVAEFKVGIPTGDGNTMTMKDEIDGIKVTAVGRVWRAVNRIGWRVSGRPSHLTPGVGNDTVSPAPQNLRHLASKPEPATPTQELVRLQSAFLPDFNHSASSSLRDGPVTGKRCVFEAREERAGRRLPLVHRFPALRASFSQGTNDRTVPPVHSALIEALLTRTIKGARNEAACFFEEANAYLFGEAYLVRPAFVLSSWSLILICLGSNPSVRTSSRLLDPVFLTSLRAYHSALFLLRDRGRSPIHLFPIV
ncbi:hypothetical protein C8J57DRAFT_1486791 [Mycena rebaudengoi]|nr:hypothetical protein C8J57DRAFT_1486791 [Mycena rebaudengoi]